VLQVGQLPRIIVKYVTKKAGRSYTIMTQLTRQGPKLPLGHFAQLIPRAYLASTHRYCGHTSWVQTRLANSFPPSNQVTRSAQTLL